MTAVDVSNGRSAVKAACRHCGLPVPPSAASAEFCCRGCESVFTLLQDGDLSRFYELGGGRGRPVGQISSSRNRDWVEEQLSESAGLTSLEADVQGIHCAACVWLLQELWQRRAGGVDMRLNPALGRMRLVFDRQQFDLSEFLDACESFGYRAGPPGKGEPDAERELLVRLGVCVALALNAMLFAFAEYFGMSSADGASYDLFRWLSAGIATLAVGVGGPVFFRSALAGLRRRVLHLDLPIAIGIALGYGASAFAFVTGFGQSYFDSVTVFVALMIAGRFIQQRAVRRNRNFLLENDGTEHVRVRRLDAENGEVERVGVERVAAGDRLLLVPGDLVPVNAVLRDDAAALSLDWINGESEPRRFERDSEIPAGAFVAGRRGITVEARSTAAGSGLSALLALPVERDGGQLGGRFWRVLNRTYVGAVLALAALAGVVWGIVDPGRVVDVVTSVLIVTCPCALGIATPLAVDLVLARLRRLGVFVRRGSLLERARHVDSVVFDKTGTLTWGGVTVRELRPVPGELTDVLATMAISSNHPVSQAIAERLRGVGTFLPDVVVDEVPGRGLVAEHGGREFRLGGRSFTLGDAARDRDAICTFTRDGHVEACFAIEEDFRAGAGDELRALEAEGFRVWLASGDAPEKVSRAVESFGLDPERARGALSPEAKADLVRSLGDRVMMVGDGLNDALAFDAAACCGTPALDRPVMPSRADFFYTGAGVGAVTAVLDSSRRFHAVVRRNLWLAGIYNALALALCFAGLMSPWLVAVLMPASSLLLIANTTWGIAADRTPPRAGGQA